jgi:hypothetical protein
LIEASELPSNIKNNFKNGKRYGKIRAISLIMSDLSDVEVVKKLIEIKIRVK